MRAGGILGGVTSRHSTIGGGTMLLDQVWGSSDHCTSSEPTDSLISPARQRTARPCWDNQDCQQFSEWLATIVDGFRQPWHAFVRVNNLVCQMSNVDSAEKPFVQKFSANLPLSNNRSIIPSATVCGPCTRPGLSHQSNRPSRDRILSYSSHSGIRRRRAFSPVDRCFDLFKSSGALLLQPSSVPPS